MQSKIVLTVDLDKIPKDYDSEQEYLKFMCVLRSLVGPWVDRGVANLVCEMDGEVKISMGGNNA